MRHKIEINSYSQTTLVSSDAPLSNKNAYIINENPFRKSESEVVKIEGRFDDILAGEIFPFSSKILVDGKIHDVTSGSNYWVAEKYRKYDFGIGILEEYLSLDQTHILGMVTAQAKAIYETMGFNVIEYPRFIVLRRVDKILRKRFNAIISSILSFLINGALRLKELLFKTYVHTKYSKFRVVEKSIEDIDFEAVEKVVFNSPYKYKEYHNRDWIKFVLNYKAANGGYQKFFEIYEEQTYVGFFIMEVRDYGELDGWKNFKYGYLIEWGSDTLSEETLFALASVSFNNDVDGIILSSVDDKVIKSIPLLGAIRNGIVNYAVRNINPIFEDVSDWRKWRIRFAGGDNII